VKVLDFGVAAVRDEASQDASITQSGTTLGTPAFMAPEQARGESKALDTRTDVYALGATLYFLLTGATPHDTDGTLLEVLKRIAEQPPRPPRSFCPDLDAGLEAILLKALDPKSGARYPSAGEMASDIDRYLRGLPLAARRHSEWYVIRTWLVRIRRRIVIGAAAIHRLPLVIRAPWNRAVRKKVGPRATSERC